MLLKQDWSTISFHTSGKSEKIRVTINNPADIKTEINLNE